MKQSLSPVYLAVYSAVFWAVVTPSYGFVIQPSSSSLLSSAVFVSQSQSPRNSMNDSRKSTLSPTRLYNQFQSNNDDTTHAAPMSRRTLLSSLAVFTTAAVLSTPAHASYSAYARREQDWQQRSEEGSVQYSNARDLKRQLKEIVPANASGRDLIFCPNGPSANVTPLMENKCGDRMALPSVYGRTQDVVGNSIPGFAGGAYGLTGESLNLSAEVGGFPKYR
jgi:hypothetical protein